MHNIHAFHFTCLLFFLAGWLPSALAVCYNLNHSSYICVAGLCLLYVLHMCLTFVSPNLCL